MQRLLEVWYNYYFQRQGLPESRTPIPYAGSTQWHRHSSGTKSRFVGQTPFQIRTYQSTCARWARDRIMRRVVAEVAMVQKTISCTNNLCGSVLLFSSSLQPQKPTTRTMTTRELRTTIRMKFSRRSVKYSFVGFSLICDVIDDGHATLTLLLPHPAESVIHP